MDKYSFERFIKQKNKNRSKKFLRIFVSFLILSAISYIFLELGFFKENTTAYYIFVGVLATITAWINGYFKAPKAELDGYIDGKITFTKNEITIGEETYPLSTIQSIAIHNNDYVGKTELEHGEFEKKDGSFGVNNQVILDLGSRNFIEVDFKQKKENEFEKMKKILIHYHKQNKLSFDDLVSILKIEFDIDKNELRKSINK